MRRFVAMSLFFIAVSCQLTYTEKHVMAQEDDNPSFVEFGGVWSPDGSTIAFNSDRDGNPDIWVIGPDGTGRKNLTADNEGSDTYPIWSPDGKFIAFDSDRAGNSDIWIMNSDGSNLWNLTEDDTNSNGAKAWSPDGTQMAFTSNTLSPLSTQLWVMAIDGTGKRNLTPAPELDRVLGFVWSSSSTQIAFVTLDALTRDGSKTSLWLSHLDGATPKLLLTDVEILDMAWSPNDSQELAITLTGSRSDIWLLNVETGEKSDLTAGSITRDLRYNFAPAWSPDGEKIAFVSDRAKNPDEVMPVNGRNIWLMDKDGSNPVNLTPTVMGQNLAPSWSPDGVHITFWTWEGELTQIWVVNIQDLSLLNLSEAP